MRTFVYTDLASRERLICVSVVDLYWGTKSDVRFVTRGSRVGVVAFVVQKSEERVSKVSNVC